MNDLNPRILGAALYVILIVIALYFGGYVQWGIYLLLVGVMAYELIKMTSKFTFFSVLSFVLLLVLPWLYKEINNDLLQKIEIVSCVVLLILYFIFPVEKKILPTWILVVFPLFYIGLTIFTFFIASKNFGDYHFEPVLILFFIMWMNDTGAYFTGKALGKTKLAPRVSPNKTWEGFAGGVLVAMIFTPILIYALGIEFQAEWIMIVGIIAIVGTVGDLLESKLKRYFGLKDSGNFFPGHGGILDRMDSFLFTIPFYFLCLDLIHIL